MGCWRCHDCTIFEIIARVVPKFVAHALSFVPAASCMNSGLCRQPSAIRLWLYEGYFYLAVGSRWRPKIGVDYEYAYAAAARLTCRGSRCRLRLVQRASTQCDDVLWRGRRGHPLVWLEGSLQEKGHRLECA